MDADGFLEFGSEEVTNMHDKIGDEYGIVERTEDTS
jgi:hypothetical protein